MNKEDLSLVLRRAAEMLQGFHHFTFDERKRMVEDLERTAKETEVSKSSEG